MAPDQSLDKKLEVVSNNPQRHNIQDYEDEVAPEAIGGTNEALPPGYYRSPNFIGTVAALCLGNCSCYLGWVLPANTLALINADIAPDPNISWVALVWTLVTSVSFILVGRLSDLLGRRWFFVGGNFIGLIGTVVGATAKSVPQLIGANCLTGIAAAVQLSFAVVISELVPNKWRGYAIGALFSSSFPFAAFVPVIAQSFILNTSAGWRWSYYLNIIVAGIAVVLFYLFYHPPTYNMLHTRHSKKDILKMFDLGGLLLFTAGLVLFLIGLNWGGVSYPWKSGRVIGTIVGGAVLLGIFVFFELYVVKQYQLIPMYLFRNRPFFGTILTAAIGSCVYYSLNVLWPVQISVLYETDVMQVGW
ncbi:fungal trichothecene efflux pump [Tothia fuscella]|uniref:Fungal trichothecene efflux pump n=1 Tax=Tothia fuscella TaxID=1048955 RepID=A0A9P4NYI0_9PEZI|nr:fungal trichothecene efflux pump [Tothia fuscella]